MLRKGQSPKNSKSFKKKPQPDIGPTFSDKLNDMEELLDATNARNIEMFAEDEILMKQGKSERERIKHFKHKLMIKQSTKEMRRKLTSMNTLDHVKSTIKNEIL